jgi:isopenicillin N synthase-like dioxygenase
MQQHDLNQVDPLVPIIDVGALFGGDEQSVQALVDDIARACKKIGFFYIRNHGIEDAFYEQAFAVSKALFALPQHEKEELDIQLSPYMRGYFSHGADKSDGINDDIKEGFDMATDLPVSDPYVVKKLPFYGPNVWPRSLPEFKTVMTEYHRRHLELGRALLRMFARGLHVPETFFDDKFVKPMAQLRTLRYPVSADRAVELNGAGEHTDFGWITMIAQQPGTGGLEVKDVHGNWVGVPVIPSTLVVNIGDLMQMWTNDAYTATFHRVINRSAVARHSIAFFMDPDYFVEIECLSSCTSADRPAKYPPIMVGDYMNKRFYETTTFREKEAAAIL